MIPAGVAALTRTRIPEKRCLDIIRETERICEERLSHISKLTR